MTGSNLTVAQAAAILNVSNRRVVAMIGSGILEAEKFGERVWMIDAESVEKRQEKMKGKKNED
jgi:excisionase family DNA binding protein